MDVILKIKKLLEDKNYSKIGLANHIDMTKQQVHNWLNGTTKSGPPSKLLPEIAAYFKVPLSYFTDEGIALPNVANDHGAIYKHIGSLCPLCQEKEKNIKALEKVIACLERELLSIKKESAVKNSA